MIVEHRPPDFLNCTTNPFVSGRVGRRRVSMALGSYPVPGAPGGVHAGQEQSGSYRAPEKQRPGPAV